VESAVLIFIVFALRNTFSTRPISVDAAGDRLLEPAEQGVGRSRRSGRRSWPCCWPLLGAFANAAVVGEVDPKIEVILRASR